MPQTTQTKRPRSAKIKPRPIRFYRTLLLYILLGTIAVLLLTVVILAVSKGSVKKELQAETEKVHTLTAQIQALQNTPAGSFFKEDIGKDYPYTKEYPDLYAEPIQPSPIDENQKVAYLSFDDGPSVLTAEFLDVLKEKGVKATFFVVGQELDTYADLLRRAVDEGHCIGIHSDSHDYEEIYASVDAYLQDFNQIFERVTEITGQKPNIFRFPGGSINAYNRSIYQRLVAEMTRRGFTYYDWTVDSGDAGYSPNVEQMMENINWSTEVYIAPVVLMHDARSKRLTVDTLPQIIDAYQQAGFTFDTLDHRVPCYFPYKSDL